MSEATGSALLLPAPTRANQVVAAWRSLRLVELLGFVVFGLFIGATDLLLIPESMINRHVWVVYSHMLFSPLICMLVVLLAWLPVDRRVWASPQRGPLRHRRQLALAILGGSALGALLVQLVSAVVGWPSQEALAQMYAAYKWPEPKAWSTVASNFSLVLLPSALLVAVIELVRQRRRSAAALQALQHEHAALAQATLEARLAAMQAQVEPQFLFDALVGIEGLYGRRDTDAPAQMQRLISYLRVALPGLREEGSTLGAEAQLLASYVAVVQGLHEGLPAYIADLPEALRPASFHAMLLLPLVQRAVRSRQGVPPCMSLTARLEGKRLFVSLEFGQAGLCEEDAELQALRERLRVLTTGTGALECHRGTASTLFQLILPL